MPLRDHFHPPLSTERRWESFHAAWLGSLADALNRDLPPGYFAEEQTHAGASVEIDVGTFEGDAARTGVPVNGSVATLPAQVWSPPQAAFTLPAIFADDFEVRVIDARSGPRLVAAIELVSPGNKDRADARRAFVTKCASYLHQGIHVLVIDIVTERHANLHNALLDMLQAPPTLRQPDAVQLYATAYRPLRRQEREEIDVWPEALAVEAALPVLPLALSGEYCLPIDLEATYTDALRRRRLES
jgi:Protein of unknown function (DUF4058)